MKKLLTILSAIGLSIAPVSTLISCGGPSKGEITDGNYVISPQLIGDGGNPGDPSVHIMTITQKDTSPILEFEIKNGKELKDNNLDIIWTLPDEFKNSFTFEQTESKVVIKLNEDNIQDIDSRNVINLEYKTKYSMTKLMRLSLRNEFNLDDVLYQQSIGDFAKYSEDNIKQGVIDFLKTKEIVFNLDDVEVEDKTEFISLGTSLERHWIQNVKIKNYTKNWVQMRYTLNLALLLPVDEDEVWKLTDKKPETVLVILKEKFPSIDEDLFNNLHVFFSSDTQLKISNSISTEAPKNGYADAVYVNFTMI